MTIPPPSLPQPIQQHPTIFKTSSKTYQRYKRPPPQGCSILSLPNEVMYTLVDFMSLADLKEFSFVCKAYHDICSKTYLQPGFKFGSRKNPKTLAELKSKNQSVRKQWKFLFLKVDEVKDFTELSRLSPSLSNLKLLKLTTMFEFPVRFHTFHNWNNFIRRFPRISSFVLNWKSRTNNSPFKTFDQRLISLFLKYADILRVWEDECFEVIEDCIRRDLPLVLKSIFENGFPIDLVNEKKRTLLMSAIHMSNVVSSFILLDYGINIYAFDYLELSALHYATTCTKTIYFATHLLESKFPIDYKHPEHKLTPLMYAAKMASLEGVMFCVENKADIHAVCGKGHNVLYHTITHMKAQETKSVVIVKYLLDKGACLYFDSNGLIWLYRMLKGTAIGQQCFSRIMDMHLNQPKIILPLLFKIVENQEDVILQQILPSIKRVDIIQNLHPKDVSYGYTPLMFAAKSCYVPTLHSFIAAGADVNFKSKLLLNKNALMIASAAGKYHNVQHLVKNSADLYASDADNRMAIEMTNDIEIIKFLRNSMKTGSYNPNTLFLQAIVCKMSWEDMEMFWNGINDASQIDPKDFAKCVMFLAQEDRIDNLLFLATKGIDVVNLTLEDGWTILCSACYYNACDVIEYLIGNGASQNVQFSKIYDFIHVFGNLEVTFTFNSTSISLKELTDSEYVHSILQTKRPRLMMDVD